MAAVNTNIWLALKSRIESIPLDFPVAMPAEKFTAPYEATSLDPYLRVGRVAVDPLPVMIEDGRRHTRTGTLIITLVHPLGQDVSVYDELAGQIAEHFADGTRMQYNGVCVRVTAHPHVQPGFEDNGYWTVPVTIPWYTFA